MLGNGVEMSYNFPPNPGSCSFGLGAPYHFVLGAQVAPSEKR